jgi:hypothetical protein
LSAAFQAFVFTLLTGFPRCVNAKQACLPICLRNTNIASAFNGTPMALRALAWSGWIHAMRRSRFTCDHRDNPYPINIGAQNKVMMERNKIKAEAMEQAVQYMRQNMPS